MTLSDADLMLLMRDSLDWLDTFALDLCTSKRQCNELRAHKAKLRDALYELGRRAIEDPVKNSDQPASASLDKVGS